MFQRLYRHVVPISLDVFPIYLKENKITWYRDMEDGDRSTAHECFWKLTLLRFIEEISVTINIDHFNLNYVICN